MKKNSTYEKYNRRAKRTRKSIGRGISDYPRLSIFRSNAGIYAQVIDDKTGKTIVAASSLEVKEKKGKKVDIARIVGKTVAERAVAAGITKVVFDRAGYRYHGRVKALADGAREGKLGF